MESTTVIAVAFFVFILALFLVLIFGTDYRAEYCRSYTANLTGELMRSDSANPADRQHYVDTYNSYISAAGCSTNYLL